MCQQVEKIIEFFSFIEPLYFLVKNQYAYDIC